MLAKFIKNNVLCMVFKLNKIIIIHLITYGNKRKRSGAKKGQCLEAESASADNG